MTTYTITESKAQLSALVEQVFTQGTPVVIGRAGRPMVQLVPWVAPTKVRSLGALKGKIKIKPDFDTWSGEEARALGIEDS